MPKVITFTANLLAETTFEFEGWREGKTARALSESFQVGGKGINVSKMLNRLDAENEALCFPGGIHGEACERWMEQNGIRSMSFPVGCEARSGVVVRAGNREETSFLGVDSVVSEKAIREAVKVLAAIDEPFMLAICGSIQNWDSSVWDELRNLVSNRPKGVALFVDTYGLGLRWFAKQAPDLIKINRDELELLFEPRERDKSTEELLLAVRKQYPCERWVITDGSEAVWLMNREGNPKSFRPPSVECISPTGCGDVFFAILIDCLYNKTGYSLDSAARLASDYASRSAAMPGIAEFDLP